jgi:hypothetical protein
MNISQLEVSIFVKAKLFAYFLFSLLIVTVSQKEMTQTTTLPPLTINYTSQLK